jgi:hypothetical protein
MLLSGLMSIGFVGCSEKATTKSQTTVTTPQGETTTTITKEVEKSGENPPPAQP